RLRPSWVRTLRSTSPLTTCSLWVRSAHCWSARRSRQRRRPDMGVRMDAAARSPTATAPHAGPSLLSLRKFAHIYLRRMSLPARIFGLMVAILSMNFAIHAYDALKERTAEESELLAGAASLAHT